MRRGPSPAALALACVALLVLLALLVLAWGGVGGSGPLAGGDEEAVATQEGDVAPLVGEVVSASGAHRRESELGVAEEAARVLGERRDAGDCVVVRSGYLDLSGRTWGCVLQGSGWVEVVVVREGAGGVGSEVVELRMDADDVAAQVGDG